MPFPRSIVATSAALLLFISLRAISRSKYFREKIPFRWLRTPSLIPLHFVTGSRKLLAWADASQDAAHKRRSCRALQAVSKCLQPHARDLLQMDQRGLSLKPTGIHLDQFPSLPTSPLDQRATRLTSFHAFLTNFIQVSDTSPRSQVLFKGSRLLHELLSRQNVPVSDSLLTSAGDAQVVQQQEAGLAHILVAAMKAGSNLTAFQQGGWQAAARALLAPPEAWQDVNFHLVMKCIDACQCKAEDCKAARDLKLTEKNIEKEKALLVNEEKKAEIKKGFVDKKLAAARVAGTLGSMDKDALEQWHIALEREADAKVAETLSKKVERIQKDESSLQSKRDAVQASAEVKVWTAVQRVWNQCGAAAIQKEFETLDSQIGTDRMARGSSFECDRAASVADLMMCDLKLMCSKTAMFTGAKWVGEWKEEVNGAEVSVKKDGEIDVLLMEKDASGDAFRVVAIAEMKSGAFDLACGEQQHKQYISDSRMRICIEKCPEFRATDSARTSFGAAADTPLFLATLIPHHDFLHGCDTDVSRCINKKLEEEGPLLRKHLVTFSARGGDAAGQRSEQYLWQFLEEISSVATALSPQAVFNQKCASGRMLLLLTGALSTH